MTDQRGTTPAIGQLEHAWPPGWRSSRPRIATAAGIIHPVHENRGEPDRFLAASDLARGQVPAVMRVLLGVLFKFLMRRARVRGAEPDWG